MTVTVAHHVLVNIDDLTAEQAARFWHHVEISRRVFEASVHSMAKGVRKYGPEPTLSHSTMTWSFVHVAETERIADHWLPHIFSEAVDAANQTGLFADALGVEL